MLYFERYAKELAPHYNMARDLFLVSNVFPDEVKAICEERNLTLPNDDTPNLRPELAP
jgi:hypothetical protein